MMSSGGIRKSGSPGFPKIWGLGLEFRVYGLVSNLLSKLNLTLTSSGFATETSLKSEVF